MPPPPPSGPLQNNCKKTLIQQHTIQIRRYSYYKCHRHQGLYKKTAKRPQYNKIQFIYGVIDIKLSKNATAAAIRAFTKKLQKI
jgi:hypothetical protein